MNRIAGMIKSKTNRAGLLMLLLAMPSTSAPAWDIVARMGAGDMLLAWLQGIAAFLGFVGVMWGRSKATGPI